MNRYLAYYVDTRNPEPTLQTREVEAECLHDVLLLFPRGEGYPLDLRHIVEL